MMKNRECPDQIAQMCMLIWTFTVEIWHKGLFLMLHVILVVYVWNLNLSVVICLSSQSQSSLLCVYTKEMS